MGFLFLMSLGGGVKVESPDCFLLPSENTDHEEKW